VPERLVLARDGRVIAGDVRRLTRRRDRIRGFLGTADAGALALVFPHTRQVHTVGMGFAIDVLFLERDGKVVHVVRAMKPWRVTRVVWRSSCVIEVGARRADDVAPGDKLRFEEV